MIGTESDAAKALIGNLDIIGEGSTRRAYMSNDIVYKVELEDDNSNAIEFFNNRKVAANTPWPFIVPPVTYHRNGVLAMPYVKGTESGECYDYPEPCECLSPCMSEDVRKIAQTIGFDIPTWGNTIKIGAWFFLIDLGSIA